MEALQPGHRQSKSVDEPPRQPDQGIGRGQPEPLGALGEVEPGDELAPTLGEVRRAAQELLVFRLKIMRGGEKIVVPVQAGGTVARRG